MKYIYALKVNDEKKNFFAFYSSLNKAKSEGVAWLKKTNKIWDYPVSSDGLKYYELGLEIHKIQFGTTDNYSDYGTHIIAGFTRGSSGPNGNNAIMEEQPREVKKEVTYSYSPTTPAWCDPEIS